MAQDLREAIAAVADRPGPVLSAYVSVNAAIPEIDVPESFPVG